MKTTVMGRQREQATAVGVRRECLDLAFFSWSLPDRSPARSSSKTLSLNSTTWSSTHQFKFQTIQMSKWPRDALAFDV